ncbi:hypothetical protein A0128_14750 [Leptospira tipperaryensis]|uniref:Uncharacterized protein n=1 Tax=Leptospira tipperaryensis TaxID=2564040 RepID=A0A1D7UZH6_9LEPT|nr:hypothetical protein [Leptospira tipperaryensis]AOP34996.1 hypothetical protein A0128_14750 [Leptospira tipperaryensis]
MSSLRIGLDEKFGWSAMKRGKRLGIHQVQGILLSSQMYSRKATPIGNSDLFNPYCILKTTVFRLKRNHPWNSDILVDKTSSKKEASH